VALERDLPAWHGLPYHRLDLRLVTQSRTEAAKFLSIVSALGWQSLALHAHPQLHAKMYTFIDTRGGGVCLIGSHNLTRGGARTNEEAGVLFSTRGDPHVGRIIRACNDRITDLMREGTIVADTLRWPPV